MTLFRPTKQAKRVQESDPAMRELRTRDRPGRQHLGCMRNGFTVIELLFVCAVVGALAVIGVPRVRDTADRMAVRRAATELVRFHREARALAIVRSTSVRVLLNSDSLVGILDDSVVLARPGPGAFGVLFTVTRPEFAFGPAGLAWGPANTRLTLERGSAVDEYVASRQGRLRRTH